jgi:hypothetical protein
MALAMMIARIGSGQPANVIGSRAKTWAAIPDTMGVAMLVPFCVRLLAVSTLTAGADTFGLLKSWFGL